MGKVIEVGVINTGITKGTSLSPVIDLDDFASIAMYLPADWTEADLTFQACAVKEGEYVDVVDELGDPFTLATAPLLGKITVLTVTSSQLAPLRFIKLRSGTSATPVNQTEDRKIVLILKK